MTDPNSKKRFLDVILVIIKEQVDEVNRFGACASGMRSRQQKRLLTDRHLRSRVGKFVNHR